MKFADALRDRDACLPRLAELLGGYEVAVFDSDSGPPADGSAPPQDRGASRRWLGEDPVKARIYRPTGLPEVVIPERYDVALDEVRQLRLARRGRQSTVQEAAQAEERLSAHPLGDALLPEDLLPVLAHLPPTVRRVALWDRPHPEGSATASVTPDGTITLFQRKRCFLDYTESSRLRRTLFQLWSHLLRWESLHWWSWFEHAARLEPVPPFLRVCSALDLAEHWALHLGSLLSLDESDGQLTLEQVPLRTAILAKALATALDDLPEDQRGQYHGDHAERAARLIQLAASAAQGTLLGHIRNAEREERVCAARLLLEMGWEHRLQDLERLTELDLSRSTANDQTLEYLRPMRRLEFLTLQEAKITDAAGKVLATLPSLRRLDVSYTDVTAGFLRPLQGMPSLKCLIVRFTRIARWELERWRGSRRDVEVVV